MRRRFQTAVERLATRLTRTVDAILRFEQDGPVKRVEIVLHAPRQRDLVARGEGRYFGSAFAAATDRLGAQIRTLRKSQRTARRVPSAGKAAAI
jgi:ribosome-associated translation inhibitor RaiA